MGINLLTYYSNTDLLIIIKLIYIYIRIMLLDEDIIIYKINNLLTYYSNTDLLIIIKLIYIRIMLLDELIYI